MGEARTKKVAMWRVSDAKEGWIYFLTEDQAKKIAADTGGIAQPVFVSDSARNHGRSMGKKK